MKTICSIAGKGSSLLASLLFIGCGAGPGDPTGVCAKFYVQNNSNYELKVEIKKSGSQASKSTYIAPIAERVLIDSECGNDNTSPSESFNDLNIYANFGSGDKLVYAGVTNKDWVYAGRDDKQFETQILSIADFNFLNQ